MKFLLLLLPIAVLLVSGCTIPGTNINIPFPWLNTISLENDVVVIKDLSAIPDEVTANQQIRLIAVIQNTGSSEFPLSNPKPESPLENKITVELFDYCQGLFDSASVEVDACPGDPNSAKKSCEITKLLPKESTEVSWTLTPKSDIKLITPCDLKVSVTYSYITDGLTTVHFINSLEYSRQLAQGTYASKASTVSLGQGPVKAWYEIKDQQPIPAAKEGSTPTQNSVTLNIENRGTGFVRIVSGWDEKPSIFLKDITNEIFDDPFKTDKQSKCSFSEKRIIPLVQDKRELICHIKQLTDNDVPKETTNQLKTQIHYLYEFRKEAKVVVNPK